MFLTALIALGKQGALPTNCTIVKTTMVLRLDRDGRFIGIEPDPKPFCSPQVTNKRTRNVVSQTAIDDYSYAIGCGIPGQTATDAAVRHSKFREMLKAAPGSQAKAFLKFLDDPTRPIIVPIKTRAPLTVAQRERLLAAAPLDTTDRDITKRPFNTEQSDTLGAYACLIRNARYNHSSSSPDDAELIFVQDDAKSLLRVEVAGNETWPTSAELLDYNQRRINQINDIPTGTCSLCLREDVPLQRLHPRVGDVNLITFNDDSSCSYGNNKGYNVPTCTDCSEAVANGLRRIMATKGTKKTLAFVNGPMQGRSSPMTLLFWSDDLSGPGPFLTLVEAVAAVKADDAEALDRALAALPEVAHVALLEKKTGRTALCRYHQIRGTRLRDSLRRWFGHLGAVEPWQVAEYAAIAAYSPENVLRAYEELFLVLLADEQPLGGTLNVLRRALAENPRSHHCRALLNFLTHEAVPMPENTTGTTDIITEPKPIDPPKDRPPNERYHFLLGKAFGRAEALQNQRGYVQRPLYTMKFQAAKRSYLAALDVIEKHSTYVSVIRGRREERVDRQIEDLFAQLRAEQCAMREAGITLTRLSGAEERAATTEGYWAYREEVKAWAKWRRALEAAAKAEATDSDPSDPAD